MTPLPYTDTPNSFKNDATPPDDGSLGDCSFASMSNEAWVNLDTQMNDNETDEFARLLSMDTIEEGELNMNIGINYHNIDNDDGGATTETEDEEDHSSSSISSSSSFTEEDNYYYHNTKPSDITMSPLTSVHSFDTQDCSMNVDQTEDEDDDEDDDQFSSSDILALPSISTSELNKRMEQSISRLAVSMKRSEMSRQKILDNGGIWGCNLGSMRLSILTNTN